MPGPSLNTGHRTLDFAELAGVTVRTLYHYDRLGLLKPSRRSSAGYRLYEVKDLERLEQIVALKFLGLTLRQIRTVLDGEPLSLGQELARQRVNLLEKRRLIDRALKAINQAEGALQEGAPTTALLRRIIEVIAMQDDSNWMMKYYSPIAQSRIAERGKTFTPEMQAEISQAWKDYYRDLADLQKHEDSKGSKAAQLANRHRDLLGAFTGNDPEVEAGLRAFYKDQVNWPAEVSERMAEYISIQG